MTRSGLLLALAALVDAGLLTRDDARALVAAYDDGADAEGGAFTLAPPLDGPALAAALTAALRAAYLRLATVAAARYGLALPPGSTGDGAAVRAVLGRVDRLPLRDRQAMIDAVRADDVRGAFGREVARRTAALNAPPDAAALGGKPGTAARASGDVARWQRAMRQAYAEDAAALARLGAGGDLTPAQLARVARVQAAKARYVDGVGVRLAQDVAGLTAKPLTEAQVRSYLVRQAGDARGLFFENAVEREAEGMGYPVGVYTDRDAPTTCPPCREAGARRYYLLEDLPMPGVLCEGGGHCHCEVSVEDNEAEYRRLSGRPLAVAA